MLGIAFKEGGSIWPVFYLNRFDRKMIIKKIESLPEEDLSVVADLLDTLERREPKRNKRNALAEVIGICEGPPDLADKHDSYA